MGSRISLRCAISWSERMITGVWRGSAMLKASTVIGNVSSTLVGASTGRSTSPWAEKAAWNRSDCSLLVGIPVAGPPRCTFTQTRGSSAMRRQAEHLRLERHAGAGGRGHRLLAGERRADGGARRPRSRPRPAGPCRRTSRARGRGTA